MTTCTGTIATCTCRVDMSAPRQPSTRFATFVDDTGAEYDIEGASVQEIADLLPEDNLRPVRVVDEAGFLRGWATSPGVWSAA